VKVAEENQRRTVGVKQAEQNGQARVAGLTVAVESEKQGIGMLAKKYEAEIVTPAQAQNEKIVLEAQAAAAMIREKGVAENEQLERTLNIIKEGGKTGDRTYIIENFARMIEPFAETMKFFPVEKLSVFTGMEGRREPISAIHPDAVAQGRNDLIAAALKAILGETTPKPPAG
jgi:flotillin